MADIADDITCQACDHTAAQHEDTDMGANTGPCTVADCSCEQMEAPPAAEAEASDDGDTAASTDVQVITSDDVDRFEIVDGDVIVHLKDGRTIASPMAVTAVNVEPPAVDDTTAALGTEGQDAEAADAEDTPDADKFQAFRMPVMVLENVDTGDGRFIEPEALSWRELPLPVMAITKTTMAHDDAELVGRLETVERVDASSMINPKTGEAYGPDTYALEATGSFTSFENAMQVAELIREKFLRGVSVDLSDLSYIEELVDADGNPIPEDEVDIEDILFGDIDVKMKVTAARVMGVTICPFPAFEGAYIELSDGTATPQEQPVAAGETRAAVRVHDRFGARPCTSCEEGQPLVASAGPMAPPASWFDDPGLDEPTPLTITEDGRVFGHLATWGECHIGRTDRCVTAPQSATNYGYFRTGAIATAEGTLIPIGQITLGTGHAGLDLDATGAMAHYDNTGTAVADIAVGEDGHGVWVAGAMRPDVTDLQVRQLRAAGLSGDWRGVGNSLELVAALAVNVQGFPVVRRMVASGATTALVAAGGRGVIAAMGRDRERLRDLEAWRADVEPILRDAMADRLAARVRGTA